MHQIPLAASSRCASTAAGGGLLGSTCHFLLEAQLENLQSSDRSYYLERLDGLNLLVQLEGDALAALVRGVRHGRINTARPCRAARARSRS
ncbi:hypothetical protein [Sorangium sp. So ce1099]|uniref:hypothetical protein n=1 Tax=Sorangium sp. So ce1099 TaxID=3133331 RepID=UPI003F5FDD3A